MSEQKSAELLVYPMDLQLRALLADERSEWKVIARPYTTAGGKNTHVRVQRPDKTWRDRDEDVGILREGQREAVNGQTLAHPLAR